MNISVTSRDLTEKKLDDHSRVMLHNNTLKSLVFHSNIFDQDFVLINANLRRS